MSYIQIAIICGVVGALITPLLLGLFGARLQGRDALWLIPIMLLVFLWGFAWPVWIVIKLAAMGIGVYYSVFPA